MALNLGVSGDIRSSLGNPSELEYSAAAIDLCQRRATNIIGSYVGQVYPDSVPFTVASSVPALLDTIATDLSIYFCKRDKHRGPNPMQAGVTVEYWDKPIEMLLMISKGELSIPELEASRGEDVVATQSSYVPVMDLDEIENAVIDPDLLDDIADSKNS